MDLHLMESLNYAFNYAVNSPYTQDNKAQWETRHGDVVKGSYSLVEPDGSLRVVDYTADKLHGFNAVVKKIGPNEHPTPLKPAIVPVAPAVAPVVAPVVPVVATVAPVVAHVAAAAPVAPVHYGFGGGPSAVSHSKTIIGPLSLSWDPSTRSYGGWRPLTSGRYATIINKKYVGGKLYKWATGPIPLPHGSKLVFTKNH
ncbi:unnamed protein product [Diatraea saccharalis]|uniref:Cuticle protein n=1 Tax=Diatraea saccharalis TaxID=40085 RepID=A0A9N9RFM2_9NEOP|nr:unnamed protein product [Diatraea saccharalis]